MATSALDHYSPVEEHDEEERDDVVPRDVGLRVEGDEDEDAEGGGEDEHGHVPHEGGVPVGQRLHSGHELKVLHLKKGGSINTYIQLKIEELIISSLIKLKKGRHKHSQYVFLGVHSNFFYLDQSDFYLRRSTQVNGS